MYSACGEHAASAVRRRSSDLLRAQRGQLVLPHIAVCFRSRVGRRPHRRPAEEAPSSLRSEPNQLHEECVRKYSSQEALRLRCSVQDGARQCACRVSLLLPTCSNITRVAHLTAAQMYQLPPFRAVTCTGV